MKKRLCEAESEVDCNTSHALCVFKSAVQVSTDRFLWVQQPGSCRHCNEMSFTEKVTGYNFFQGAVCFAGGWM